MIRIVLFLVLACWACGGTETDNPLSTGARSPDENQSKTDGETPTPPTYESRVGLSDPSTIPPGCPAPDYDGKPRELPLAGVTGIDLFAANPDGDLLWIDVGDPAAPAIKARVLLAGAPQQVSVAPGPAVTAVIRGFVEQSLDHVPDPRTLEPQTRLVRLIPDGSDAMRQVAEITLEGEFWRMTTTEDANGDITYWIMAAREKVPVPYCDLNPFGCGSPDRDALLITGYRYVEGGFERVQAVELPMQYRAWATDTGYAADVVEEIDGPATLHFVRFEQNGLLGEPGRVALPFALSDDAAVNLGQDQLRVYLRDPEDRVRHLVVYDLSQQPARSLSSTSLPGRDSTIDFIDGIMYPRVHFIGTDVFVEGSGGWRIDLRDPFAPTIESLAIEMLGLWELAPFGTTDSEGTRHIAILEADADGALSLSLLASDEAGFAIVDQLTLPEAADGALTAVNAHLVQQGDVLWLLAPTVDRTRHLHGLRVTDNGLTLIASDPVSVQTDDLLATDRGLFGVGHSLITIHEPTGRGGDADFIPLAAKGRVVDVAAGGDFVASLRDIWTDGVIPARTLQIQRGELTETLEVSRPAEALLATDSHVLLISDRPVSQCWQSGVDCSDYAPNVLVVDTRGTLQKVAEVRLPESPVRSAEENPDPEFYWQLGESEPTLRLSDGRYIFTAELDVSCGESDECSALGIENFVPLSEANIVSGICVESGPNGESNGCPPPASVYGRRREQRFYVLDHTADPPTFELVGVSRLMEENSFFGPPHVSGQALLATRVERSEPGAIVGPNASLGRIMLDIFEVEPNGEATPLTPINVPGYPLSANLARDRLLSVERTSAGLTLYRSELTDGAARIIEMQTLPGTFDSAAARDNSAFLVTHEGQGCDAVTYLYGLDANAPLTPGTPLALGGEGYSIEDVRGDRLLLAGRGDQIVLVNLIEPDTPHLERFVIVPRPLYAATLATDDVYSSNLKANGEMLTW